MKTTPMLDLARRGWLGPMLQLGRWGTGAYRVAFRGAGLRSGILHELGRGPATAAQLVARLDLDSTMTEGLVTWLDAGVTLGDLDRRGDRYVVRSRGLRRLLRPENDPVAAMTEEMATLHHTLLLETPDRLRTGRPFELADADPATTARSSRMGEPWIRSALERVVPRTGSVRLLEVGPGSGAHLRTAAALNPRLTALGVELQEAAAELTRRNVAEWGLSDRVEVAVGDIRDREPGGGFDLVTLHQNIYYFPEPQQTEVLRRLSGFLKPGGTLLITTLVRGRSVGTLTLDLWGAMTRGTSRLPVPADLVERMRQAGLGVVWCMRLGQEGMYAAFVGRREG